MKSVLYFTDIIALVKELRQFVGYRLINIYDVYEHTYLVKLRNDTKSFVYLYVRPGKYIFKTNNPTERRRKLPSSFCTRLRKYLNNKRLSDLSTYRTDRIIRLYFGDSQCQYCLVVELYGASTRETMGTMSTMGDVLTAEGAIVRALSSA